MDTATGNEDMAAAWGGDEGEHWSQHQARYDAAIAAHERRLVDHAAIGAAERVVDIGCGCGASTRDAARAARSGHAFGVDLSPQMLARARTLAEDEGLTNVSFEQADAQVHAFDGAYDVAISRFGVMFFADPVAAFTNIGRALRPDGRLRVMVWQALAHNEWALTLVGALAAGRDLPSPPPDAPGPFSLADPDRTRHVLSAAGFEDVALVGFEERFAVGADAGDAFAFVSGIPMARGLLKDLDDERQRRALDNLRAALGAHQTPDGVVFGSSAWLVSARRP